MKASFSMTRAVGHTSQRTAILKLAKLPAFPSPAIATQSPRGEGEGGGKVKSFTSAKGTFWLTNLFSAVILRLKRPNLSFLCTLHELENMG
jgi:hypothetical protein